MNLLFAYQRLRVLEPTFSTQDAAHVLRISPNHAATVLSRLAQQNTIIHLARDRWAYSHDADPLLLPNILTHPMQAYISLYSALYYRGMIDQIPDTIFAISNGKTKLFHTPIATISIHHINPKLFTGYEVIGKYGLLIAISEKALFDSLYLMPAKSNLFRRLTEIELPNAFQFSLFQQWLKCVKHKGRRLLIEKGLATILEQPHR